MEQKQEIKIEKSTVARAARKALEAYYVAVGPTGYDWAAPRPGDWEENEELFNAIYKSKYVSSHLDWLYVCQLIYAVLDNNGQLSPNDFAEKLEKLIAETAGEREFLAIVPLAFRTSFGFGRRAPPLNRPLVIGDFTFSPAAPTVKVMNKIIGKHGFSGIGASDFEHAKKTSQEAFSSELLVSFTAHGAEDWLRFTVESKVRVLMRLIEVFANLFGDVAMSFGQTKSVRHFFLLNKTTGELRRFPAVKPLSLDLGLESSLLTALKKPEFEEFYSAILSSKETMYNRMRNATKFFSMAFNADDKVSSFLFYVVSIESIFSRDKNSPIKATLADLASILCFPPTQRLGAYEIIRKSYDLRSAIVHAGATSVRDEDVIAIRLIAARAIFCGLFLSRELKEGNGKLEDRFFNHLRDLKLGVTKSIPVRSIWSLPEIGTNTE